MRDVFLTPLLRPGDLGPLAPTHLSAVGPYGALTYTTEMGGPTTCEWEMLTGASMDPRLTRGLVSVCDAGRVVWVGQLDYPEPGSGRYRATGLRAICAGFPALGDDSDPSATPDDVWSLLALAGLAAPEPGVSLGSTEVGDPESQPTVGAVLEAAADELGAWWSVDPWPGWLWRSSGVRPGLISYRTLDAEPAWQMRVTEGGLAPTDEAWCTRLLGRYTDITTGLRSTVQAIDAEAEAMWGTRYDRVDLDAVGPLEAVRAQARVDGLLERSRRGANWATTLTPGRGELMSMTGAPVASADVVAPGQAVRVHGIWDDLTSLRGVPYADVPIGSVTVTESGVTLQPLGKPAETVREAFADLSEEAA